ncbi:PAS domain-containing sensor histidine kinase [Geovibrio thiophilus]|uniref:histidine kinase n=1 Tax=Geovibrio thiophilus TaxID=139438 RepID=A0A410K2D5_9BACT|nr:PAS domain-containing sensor histidine kinase [Geovibrio thiophilus]QAR34408.1 PAS domain-containing sensor histidine kinase [Geovibrio thiophilus]
MKSFKLIAEISDRPLFLLDGEGTVLGFNKRASELYSLCAENAGNVKICSLCRNTDRQCSFSNLFSGGYRQKITHGAVHRLAADKSVRVTLELYPFSEDGEEPDGKIICAVRQTENEVFPSESGEKVPFVLNSLSAMVYVINPSNSTMLYINSHALEALGCGESWQGEKCWKVIHGRDEKCSHCGMDSESFSESSAEEVFNNRTGRWYFETGRLIGWDGGRSARLVIAHDIDERKKLELLREDVERIMRHDLKTPLNAIYLLGQTLEASSESEDTRFLASKIIESCFQLNAMINLSQVLYRLERGDYTVKKRDVLLDELLGRVCSHLEGLAASYRVKIRKVFQADTPGGFIVRADDLLLYSCLSNLVTNAIEASPEGETVQVECEKTNGRDVIAVSNKGEIPREIVDRFFEKYITKGKTAGTGLGTYSAKLLAEAHGGTISFMTGEGFTRVTVSLPAD